TRWPRDWSSDVCSSDLAVALAAKLTTGYALFVAPPYRVELSLNLTIVLTVAAFVVGYGLLRIFRRMLGLPQEVRAFRRRQQQERSEERRVGKEWRTRWW